MEHAAVVGLRRPGILLATLALGLAVAAASGCSGGGEKPATPAEPPPAEAPAPAAPAPGPQEPPEVEVEPIRIGHLSSCDGPFARFYDETTAGAMLPLIRRGATPNGPKGNDGVSGAVVAGRPIEIVWGCSNGRPDTALAEAQRLVELEGAEIVLGPLAGDEGVALAGYSKEQQDATFVNGASGAPEATLKVRSPNFFRFNTDWAQWAAGLGDYAYNTLGWRKVVAIGEDGGVRYSQIAGFVAEFCALGGKVVARLWLPPGEADHSSSIAEIPKAAEGIFLAVDRAHAVAFLTQYAGLEGSLADHVLGGLSLTDPSIRTKLRRRVVGVVAAGPTANDSTEPAFTAYAEALAAAYPELAGRGGSAFLYSYYSNMEAILQALEAVDADLSDGQVGFREALLNVVLAAPNGEIALDENRQAIADNFLQRIVEDRTGDGIPDVATLKVIRQVDQSFAERFRPDTPSADRENPKCVPGNPPPWTKQGRGG